MPGFWLKTKFAGNVVVTSSSFLFCYIFQFPIIKLKTVLQHPIPVPIFISRPICTKLFIFKKCFMYSITASWSYMCPFFSSVENVNRLAAYVFFYTLTFRDSTSFNLHYMLWILCSVGFSLSID